MPRWDFERFRREVRVREEGERRRAPRVVAPASILALLAGLCLALYLLMLGWRPWASSP